MFDDIILTPRADLEEARELLMRLRKRGAVIGTDEAGRGALAGPVMAAAVYLTNEQEEKLLSLRLRDSKRLNFNMRERIFEAMREMKILWHAHAGSVEKIEHDNILQASLWSMGKCVSRLADNMEISPACVIVDGTEKIPGLKFPQWTLIRADNIIPAVSAASIIAKVLRDRLMIKFSAAYPDYNFAQNKGYPTREHMETILLKGISDIHRPSFCRKLMQGRENNQCRQ